MLTRLYAALAILLLAPPLGAAVPGQVDFQGLLLDAAGEKVNGAVDLTFRLYDAPFGGNLLWTETHPDLQVTDGVYGVTLGLITPLTQEVLAGGNVHLEIQVDGETLTPRRQLLAVPYAIRSESADNVAGVAGGFYSEIIEHFPFDGSGGPPNDDPSEGTADVDGDGRANFIDSDNDGDGLEDEVEVAGGSDINLVTPVISSLNPPAARESAPGTITVHGSNFQPGFTVAFGADSPTPFNVTPTSFQVTLGPQPIGPASIVVTNPNGEADQAPYSFHGRRVFLSATTNGNIGGVAGGDSLCAAGAATLGLTGTFLAWLGDATTSPAARFSQTGGFSRVDGTKIADSWADLTDGTLDAPVSGGGGGVVWTGVEADGTAEPPSCSNWTTSDSGTQGLRGISVQSGAQWTWSSAFGCNFVAPLYCFEQ